MPKAPPPPGAVQRFFDSFDAPIAARLWRLRALIYDVASRTPEIGALSETIKWGEPSYAPLRKNVGSPVRLGVSRRHPGQCALFFVCHTTLVERFREFYGDRLAFEKNRAVIVSPTGRLPTAVLRDCIAAALAYHLRKKKSV
ncbi:MAG: DUF1801 domain-containing protein [Amphiplicatus sp.]